MKKNNVLILIFISGLILTAGCFNKSDITNSQVPSSGNNNVEKIAVSTGEVKEFNIIAKQWDFEPDTIKVNKGDTVKLHITSIDVVHGFRLSDFSINERLEPGQTVDIEFVADKTGTFPFICSIPCGSGHGGMNGQLIIK